ncbi:MAG: hypothetical protein MZV70_72960 [Desulfobacterales bacterium]|nr:hypothetical protein [Desulfobacterales bacterium]
MDARGWDEGVFVPPEAMNSALARRPRGGEPMARPQGPAGQGRRPSSSEPSLTVTGRYVRQRKFGVLEPLQADALYHHRPAGARG